MRQQKTESVNRTGMYGAVHCDSVCTSVFLTEMLLSGQEIGNLLVLCVPRLLDHISSAQHDIA